MAESALSMTSEVPLREHLTAVMAERDRHNEAEHAAIRALIEAYNANVATALAAQEKAVSAALAASEKAVAKAETAAEKRFEGLNELRGMAEDGQRVNMPRKEVEVIIGAINEKIGKLESRASTYSGRETGKVSGQQAAIALFLFIFAVAGFAFGLLK